jgi:hypothetical protein
VGATTSFHHDGARFQVGQISNERDSIEFFSAKLMTAIILRMQVKRMFSQVDGGNSYFVHGNNLR